MCSTVIKVLKGYSYIYFINRDDWIEREDRRGEGGQTNPNSGMYDVNV